ncbi:MAG TPA: class I SAM-dependent methyltransferase [Solirubrobacterales bacterium]|nr:class I SAM-dependent methyltransferase [Solirubrobacterales bacterium]
MTTGPGGDCAERAFEAMAPLYDDFTAHHEYEFWTAQLLAVLEREGLEGRRLLDVGCGTGKSFLPMLPRGWRVMGCDISASMLDLAQQKVGDAVRLEVADMRKLPCFGEFDLVWALDDAINYLLSAEELEAALGGMRSNLATSGLLLFDVNELPVYAFYAEGVEVELGGRSFVWQGGATGEVEPGSIYEFSCFEERPSGDGQAADRRNVSVHRQRHFTETEILGAIERAGLECLSIYGQSTDGIPRQPLDGAAHTKAIYIARAA